MIAKAEILLMKDRVKNHISEHKTEYWVGSLVVVAGVTCIVTRRVTTPQISVAPVFNNTVAPIINNTVNNGGHMRKIVRCVETGEVWLSVTDTAKALGKSISVISQHLNHPELSPDINGLHYVIEALATS